MKASELAAEARDEIYMGWTQDEYSNMAGHVCAVGAVERVALRNMAIAQAGIVQAALNEKAQEMFGQAFGRNFDRVQSFNDDLHTTRDDVLALFDKVTLELGERGE